MVKSETRQDAEILLKNPSLRLLGEKFQDLKKVKTTHTKTRLQDLPKMLSRLSGLDMDIFKKRPLFHHYQKENQQKPLTNYV